MDPLDEIRLRNWYFRKLNNMYILCADRYKELTNDKVSYVYDQFGFLEIVKVVSSGFKCRVITSGCEEKIYNCRWDMADSYFKYKPTLLARFTQYKANMKDLAEYLDNGKLIALHEEKNRPLPIMED